MPECRININNKLMIHNPISRYDRALRVFKDHELKRLGCVNARVLFALHSRSGTDGIHEEIVVITGCFPHSETSKTFAGDELALSSWKGWAT